MENLKLGMWMRDTVTGFSGYAINKMFFLNGCIQYALRPKAKNPTELPDSVWVDDQQLLVDKKIKPLMRNVQNADNGFKLGQTLKDSITGFSGIATGKAEFLNGQVQFGLKPKQKEGETKVPEAEWFDASQLVFVNSGVLKTKKVSNTGGPSYDMPSRNGMSKI